MRSIRSFDNKNDFWSDCGSLRVDAVAAYQRVYQLQNKAIHLCSVSWSLEDSTRIYTLYLINILQGYLFDFMCKFKLSYVNFFIKVLA